MGPASCFVQAPWPRISCIGSFRGKMETYDRKGSGIQAHISGDHQPMAGHHQPMAGDHQPMAGHTHGLRFCQNIKGQLPALSVGMDQRTDRHRITELPERGHATRKVKGSGPCSTFTCRAWVCWWCADPPESVERFEMWMFVF